MYALERLTAPEPKWETAIIYIKGTEPFIIDSKGGHKISWIRDEHLLKIELTNIDSPFDPSREPMDMGDGHFTPAYPGTTVDLTDFIYEEEITRVSFFENPRVKVIANMPESVILTPNGENAQEVIRKQEERAKRKGGLKKV